MKNFKYYIITALIILSTGLIGCGNKNAGTQYNIYYTNSEGYSLVSEKYNTEETDKQLLAEQLISQMNSINDRSADIVILKPANVIIDKVVVENDIANVYFSKEYYEMGPAKEVLLRSGIVKTITQIEGIDYSMFYVDNAQAVYNDGKNIGLMAASDFIDDTENNVNNLQWTELTLYYSNQKGDKLVKDRVSVAYNKNISLERLVVEQLINGPQSNNCYDTLPEGLHLLSVSVNNGICYVNFDSSFLTEIVNVSNEIPIYSVVNSLCELGNIDSVKIMINGDSNKVFRESISLERKFEYNKDIIS